MKLIYFILYQGYEGLFIHNDFFLYQWPEVILLHTLGIELNHTNKHKSSKIKSLPRQNHKYQPVQQGNEVGLQIFVDCPL